DDQSLLYLSTDETPANKQVIASVSSWTSARDWFSEANQQSAAIRLDATKFYYIEAVMKEGTGGDNLAVRWQLPNGTIEEPVPAFRLFPFGTTLTAPIIVSHPRNLIATEGENAVFSVRVRNADPLGYQWQRNGVNIPRATFGTYTNRAVSLIDDGAQYRVLLTNALGSLFSAEAALFVLPDRTPPTVRSIHNIGTTNLVLTFSEPINLLGATQTVNYAIGNNATITGASAGPDGRTVFLTSTPLVPGATYVLGINALQDRAASPNSIAANTQVVFTALDFAPLDIGNPAVTGTVAPAPNGVTVSGGGRDIGGLSDQFQFAYQERGGDFDFKVRLDSFGGAGAFAQAGLMARQTLATNSPFASVLATPNIGGTFFEFRETTGSVSVTTGSLPVNYPNTWLRLRRERHLFSGFASFDGQTWSSLGAVTLVITNRLFFGLAVTSRSTNQTARAEFRELLAVEAGIIRPTPRRDDEPLGPSSRRTGLVLSEIMYHPKQRGDGKVIEYVELCNTQPFAEDVSQYRLEGAVDFRFPAKTVLAPGEFLVVARAPADVQAVYGITNVLGGYANSLQNNSGTVRLLNRQGAVLLEVSYSDESPWPAAADGAGHSLVLARPSYGERNPKAWAPSDLLGGSPGQPELVQTSTRGAVVLNEFLAHTDDPQLDFIELYNRSDAAEDISGCVLTDDSEIEKFIVPSGTILPPHGFLSYDQSQLGFALSSAGEAIYLISADRLRVIDAIRFGPQARGIATGRYPDGAPLFSELISLTPGKQNGDVLTRDIVINEIMHNPISNDSADEYLELHNRSVQAVNVENWRLMDGIEFTFPVGTTIPGGGFLVVAKDREHLLAQYPALSPVQVVGGFNGMLSNNGERVALAMPDEVRTTNANQTVTVTFAYVVVDEVAYGAGGRWGKWSDGGGSSLELIDAHGDNRLASNWTDSRRTPGNDWVTIEHTGVLDHGTSNFAIDSVQILLLGAGECLVDNVEVFDQSGVNLVSNPAFEAGLSGWTMRGTHSQSKIRNGEGFQSARSLHLIASDRGDTGPNQIVTPLRTALEPGGTATIRAQVKWLAGHPEILLRLHGNYLDATGPILRTARLGTPGAPNSTAAPNAGPAIYDVTHFPILPAENEPVLVQARVDDPDGISSVRLQYRFDPAVTIQTAVMRDDGTAGDETAGDGIFSATIPGQAPGVLAAFHVEALDNAPVKIRTVFPSDAPTRECLILFGETQPAGSLGTYRIWFTQATLDRWTNREPGSNEPLDATFVYGDSRVIYNIQTLYSGSPWHWRGYTSPLFDSCNYEMIVPADDLFLGTTDFVLNLPSNQGSDNTAIREQIFYWLVDQLRHPYTYRRFHHLFVNGLQRGSIFEDSQQPNREFVEEWFPDDPAGDFYKIEDWFEFDDAGFNFSNVDASLQLFTTTGGEKKLARYRWAWRKRALQDSANDYAQLFTLVDAVNTPDPDAYTTIVESLVDVDEWARAIALRHVVGDWDAYGYDRGKNMYAYKPPNGKWQLLHWDIAFAFGLGHGTSHDVFDTIEPVIRRMFSHPPFRRLYFQALQEALDGPMKNENIDPIIDARSVGLQANGIPVSSANVIKTYLANRRRSIGQLLSTNDAPFEITSNGGESFVSEGSLITLQGTAPFRVRTIQINGVTYPLLWNTTTNWSTTLPLQASQNLLSAVGFNAIGTPVTGASDSILVVFNGTLEQPENHLVINEIMHHPEVPDAEFLELHNTSRTQAFDLSNYFVEGIDFTFPTGTLIQPETFLVLVKDQGVFQNVYGTNIPIAGQFDGRLDNSGETLSLVRRGAAPSSDVVIDAVTYSDLPPWPSGAAGAGGSLQLIDPAQDNARAANWAATGNEWQFVSVTGTATSSNLLIHLEANGDVHIDDVVLVAGVVPRVGSNLIRNGGFEEPLAGTWIVPPALEQTGINSEIRRLGTGSLHLRGAGTQAVRELSVAQQVAFGPVPDQFYTLSYWYLPGQTTARLTVKLEGDGILSTHETQTELFGLSTPGSANAFRSALAPFPALWINEVLPDNNLSGVADRAGDPDPWLELFNSGPTAIPLNGYFLSDSFGDPKRWAFPPDAVIGPGQFLTVWADGEAAESSPAELHAGFRLQVAGGSIGLGRLQNGQVVLVDHI
ncbi:MAG: lamin tail domain-containing protein, partial [Verrucomicrobiales bacterium]|nr:lamin tail domain-containing protein [Verrucomicrobiales bacterium]